VKFRPARKVQKGERKAWREEETKPVLFGMDLCTPDKPLIITEGEIDTLSLYEAGLENVVSIPSGSQDFTWLETCWEWLQQFQRYIICGDNDTAGKEMVKEAIKKLGHYKCSVVELERKDANEVLYFDGKETLVEAVKNAKDVPIFGIVELADVEPLDEKNIKIIKSGLKSLDEALGGFRYGELSVWTGKRGEGKSTIMNQLSIEAIAQGEKVCMYSGEMKAQDIQYWVNLQLAGRNFIKKYFCSKRQKDIFYVPDDVKAKIINWYRGKFFLYDNNIAASKSEESSILKVFEHCVRKYDIRLFVVDNLMTAKYESTNENDFYLRQINFVRDLLQFASNYNVHIHLVAHPKKTKGKIDNDDISGRSEITNLAHNVFNFERTNGQGQSDLAVDILKNRWEGVKETIGLYYCPVSRRIYSKEDGPLKRYGFETNENYTVELNVREDCPF
jgi:twinkle protein